MLTTDEKRYSMQDLLKLKNEYLLTLDYSNDNEWYCSAQELAASELSSFLGWVNIRENTP